jgi:hypothetical protein
MALRILILVSSLTVPVAMLRHHDAVPVGQLSLRPVEASDSRLADGHLHPFVGCNDLLCSPQSLADDDREDNGDGVKALARAIREVGGIDPAMALGFPAQPSPRAARCSSWRIPLRC